MNHSIICQLYHMASFEFNLLQEIHKGSLKNKSTKKNITSPSNANEDKESHNLQKTKTKR